MGPNLFTEKKKSLEANVEFKYCFHLPYKETQQPKFHELKLYMDQRTSEDLSFSWTRPQ